MLRYQVPQNLPPRQLAIRQVLAVYRLPDMDFHSFFSTQWKFPDAHPGYRVNDFAFGSYLPVLIQFVLYVAKTQMRDLVRPGGVGVVCCSLVHTAVGMYCAIPPCKYLANANHLDISTRVHLDYFPLLLTLWFLQIQPRICQFR